MTVWSMKGSLYTGYNWVPTTEGYKELLINFNDAALPDVAVGLFNIFCSEQKQTKVNILCFCGGW